MLLLAPAGTRWEKLNSTHFTSPGGCDSVAIQAAVGGDGWRVASDDTTGCSTRAHNQIVGHAHWRASEYYPYGGDGIYRGSISQKGVKAFDIDITRGTASNYRKLTPVGFTGGLSSLRLTSLMHQGQALLIGGSRTGVIYLIPGSNASRPVPLVDNETGLLFSATVIGASPISYPRDADNDDMIIGGENSLHFVVASSVGDREHAIGGGDTVGGSLRLQHAGPVQHY